MAHITIELTRDDLVKNKSDLPINEINCYDFKASVLSKEEIRRADLIIFKDGKNVKELKNKYSCEGDGPNYELNYNNFYEYLIMVGIRSAEYTYTNEQLLNGVNYFRDCYNRDLSVYKALLFFNDNMKREGNI